MPLPKGEGRVHLIFCSLSSWERGEGLISLHRAGEGGLFAVRDATSEFGIITVMSGNEIARILVDVGFMSHTTLGSLRLGGLA